MGTLMIHGNSGQGTEMATKILGTAFFESGFDVLSFIKKMPYSDVFGYIKYEKPKILSKDTSNVDFFILLDNNTTVVKDAEKGSVMVINSKKQALKKLKTKNFFVDSAEITAESDVPPYFALLGGFVKIFDKVSMKSMKKAVEISHGKEKKCFDMIDAGYSSLKR